MKIPLITLIALAVANARASSPQVVNYSASPSSEATDSREIGESLSRLDSFGQPGVTRQFSSSAPSLKFARQLIEHLGLNLDAAALAEVIQRRATQEANPGDKATGVSVEHVSIFDKALARNGKIPEELRPFVQYRPQDDVLLTKDSAVRWIMVRDSSDRTKASQAFWTEGLADHECLALDHLARKRAFEMFVFVVQLAEQEIGLDEKPSKLEPSAIAAAKIRMAWGAAMMIGGKFNGNRAFEQWRASQSSGSPSPLLVEAGGMQALLDRFDAWAQDPSLPGRVFSRLTLKR